MASITTAQCDVSGPFFPESSRVKPLEITFPKHSSPLAGSRLFYRTKRGTS